MKPDISLATKTGHFNLLTTGLHLGLAQARLLAYIVPTLPAVSHMAETKPKPVVTIRDLQSFDDMKQVEEVEREVWGLSDLDSTPLTLAIATREAGSIWVGAFEGLKLVGFAFGFLGAEHGQLIVLYCGCCPWDKCPNAKPAYEALHSMGFTNVKVVHIANNFGANWVDTGLPTTKAQ